MPPFPLPLKSPVPTTDHMVETGAIGCRDRTAVPFMNQIALLPLVSRHSRSYLPSPSKSRWPTSDQVRGGVPIPASDRI
jgi:hypothetical protein